MYKYRSECDELRANDGHNLLMQCVQSREDQLAEKELISQTAEQGKSMWYCVLCTVMIH